MKVVIFGATGMIGQSVLRECLQDPKILEVLTIGRKPTGVANPKLREIQHPDMSDLSALEPELAPFDACFYCLGATSAGLNEQQYTRVTYDLAMACATALLNRNPNMVFIFVSGTGADSTEKGPVMWARIKGKTENAILALPFKDAYVFRPAAIQPMHGVVSSTASYRILYTLTKPILPLLRRLFPNQIVTSEKLAKAMVHAARHEAPKKILESADVNKMRV